MDFSSYKNFLKREYPSAYEFLKKNPWKPVFFSDTVSLTFSAFQQMETVVKSLFRLKSRKDYQKSLSAAEPESSLKNKKQDSVLMAYDFHLKDGIPYLIEVNTNASGFLLVNSFYQFQNYPYSQAKEDLKQSFQKEWEKFCSEYESDNSNNFIKNGFLKSSFENNNKKIKPDKIVLIDEALSSQKMLIEFFMYKDFFQSMNWPFEICDSRSLKADDRGFLYTPKGDKIDFVYNRSTDFYFENHPALATAYRKGVCAISPHPREYHLLANKSRLCGWYIQKEKWEELKQIERHIPYTEILTEENKGQFWKNRKKYFFKIKTGHSGKMAYRGSSLSRRKFEELCRLNGIAQEYIPPSLVQSAKGGEWKVDFRVYVYEDQIQQITARCYQGQLTNFQAEGSGFSAVNVLK